MLTDAAQRDARRQRFKAEARRGPPPVPQRTFAHPEKLVKSDADACLAKLLARKAAAGVTLTPDQRRALETLGDTNSHHRPHAKEVVILGAGKNGAPHPPAPTDRAAPAPSSSRPPNRRVIVLRKKLREIDELQRRESEEGAVLQDNQKSKIASKDVLEAELTQLTSS